MSEEKSKLEKYFLSRLEELKIVNKLLDIDRNVFNIKLNEIDQELIFYISEQSGNVDKFVYEMNIRFKEMLSANVNREIKDIEKELSKL